jgi:hypothetical protein
MATENMRPDELLELSNQEDELLELSNQELDNIAGGATNATDANNEQFSDAQFSFVELPKEGGIISFTKQETFFSEQDLKEFQDAGIPL